MRTNYNRKLISRINLLNDLYEEAEIRQVRAIELLQKWDRSSWDEPIKYRYRRDELEDRVEQLEAVRKRIKLSYNNQVENLKNTQLWS